ncbi:MAG: hypothetical protein Kow0092_21990 [Deferrisomatales bacterium]
MLRFGSDRMNRFWHLYVRDAGEKRVEAVGHYVDPWYELSARLAVSPVSYRIREATVEVMRTPAGREGSERREVPGVVGAIAYAGVGRRVVDSTRDDPTGLQAGLLLECVKALRQARLFVWERNGINPADYLDLIEAYLRDSCIYFSFPGALQAVIEPVQLEEMTRWEWLFSRHKYCLLRSGPEGETVEAGLADSYHEMRLEVQARGGEVGEASAEILRAPHEECFLAEPKGAGLRAACLQEGGGGWEARVGGADGCAHLADLARQAHATLAYWRRMRSVTAPENRCVPA